VHCCRSLVQYGGIHHCRCERALSLLLTRCYRLRIKTYVSTHQCHIKDRCAVHRHHSAQDRLHHHLQRLPSSRATASLQHIPMHHTWIARHFITTTARPLARARHVHSCSSIRSFSPSPRLLITNYLPPQVGHHTPPTMTMTTTFHLRIFFILAMRRPRTRLSCANLTARRCCSISLGIRKLWT